MTITDEVQSQLFRAVGSDATAGVIEPQVIRIPPTRPAVASSTSESRSPTSQQGTWTRQEHERFLEGLAMFPSGPWKEIASHIGTKTPRQAMTHAQKYRQKIARRQRGLKKTVRDRPAEEDEEEGQEEKPGSLPLMTEEEFTAFLEELDLSDDENVASSPFFASAGDAADCSDGLESPLASPVGDRDLDEDFSPAVLNALRDSVFSRTS